MPTTTAERPQLDPDTARHVWLLIARPETRQYGMQLYNALMTPQANGAGTPSVRPKTAFEKTIEPITSYPETYARMNREALEQAKRGLFGQIVPSFRAAATPSPAGMSEEEIRRRHAAGAVELVKGIGNLGFGALGYFASPANAGLRTIFGNPIEKNTGIPREYTEFALGLGMPGVGWARLGGARVPGAPGLWARPTLVVYEPPRVGPPPSSFSGSLRAPLHAPAQVPPRNLPGQFKGVRYSGHTFDQMQNRGILPGVVDQVIRTGIHLRDRTSGTIMRYDPINNITVIQDATTGNVITIRPGRG